jgi:hypothetical protein
VSQNATKMETTAYQEKIPDGRERYDIVAVLAPRGIERFNHDRLRGHVDDEDVSLAHCRKRGSNVCIRVGGWRRIVARAEVGSRSGRHGQPHVRAALQQGEVGGGRHASKRNTEMRLTGSPVACGWSKGRTDRNLSRTGFRRHKLFLVSSCSCSRAACVLPSKCRNAALHLSRVRIMCASICRNFLMFLIIRLALAYRNSPQHGGGQKIGARPRRAPAGRVRQHYAGHHVDIRVGGQT